VNRWTAVLPAATALCSLALLTWQVIAGGVLTKLDLPVYHWVIQHGMDRSSLPWVLLSELGDGRVMLPIAALLASALVWRKREALPVVAAAAALGFVAGAGELMKIAIGRAAPGRAGDAAFVSNGGAFPSGHAAGAAAMCGVIAFLALRLAGIELRPSLARACLAVGGIAGVCAGLAMVRMGYHWLTDAAGGWLLGVGVLDIMLLALRWRHQPRLRQAFGRPRSQCDSDREARPAPQRWQAERDRRR
jgi:undecaprenyl-diphosphatase